jgi:hypothetical protein
MGMGIGGVHAANFSEMPGVAIGVTTGWQLQARMRNIVGNSKILGISG